MSKKKFRFNFSIGDFPLTSCQKVSRPTILRHALLPDLIVYEPLDVILYDVEDPLTSKFISSLIFDQNKSPFKSKLNIFNKKNEKIECWNFHKCRVLSANFGDCDSTSEEALKIHLKISYEYYTTIFDFDDE